MTVLITFFFMCLALLVASIWWLIKALVAAVRRQRRPGLYWGTPVALVALAFSGWEIVLLLVGFAVALVDGGSGGSR